MSTRTDAFRKSAAVPADFEHVHEYSLSTTEGGWPVPSLGINCQIDFRREIKGDDGKTTFVNGTHAPDGMCCIVGMLAAGHKFADHGSAGSCTLCGAAFIHGSVYRHTPTGILIHAGHTCSRSLDFAADTSGFEGKRLAFVQKAIKDARFATLAERSGLAGAFAAETTAADRSGILIDLARKLRDYGELSDKQIALARKIENEIRNPVARVEEVNVPAPVGRVVVAGEVISVKRSEGAFGITTKITIKVRTDAGAWLAWGTCPASLLDVGVKRGDSVEVTATLKPGRDAHFALMSRPTGGKITAKAEAAAPAPVAT